jgi:hypothetical protein
VSSTIINENKLSLKKVRGSKSFAVKSEVKVKAVKKHNIYITIDLIN